MAKKVLTVVVNGRPQKRATDRTYAYAILGLRDKEKAQVATFGWTAAEQKQALENWQYHRDMADGTFFTKHGFVALADGVSEARLKEKVRHQAIVDAGLDAYIQSEKDEKVEHFNREEANGAFLWHAFAWAGSLKLAEAQARKRTWWKAVQIVPVGAEVVLPE